jgi:hypothetical protein
MIKFKINTYYSDRCRQSLVRDNIRKAVSERLRAPENTAVWEELLAFARNSVAEEDRAALTDALNKANPVELRDFITVLHKDVVIDGYLEDEPFVIPTMLRYVTPFIFDVDRFWSYVDKA